MGRQGVSVVVVLPGSERRAISGRYAPQAHLLRVWRRLAGLSQATVAATIHVSEAYVSMWENGTRRCSLQQLEALDALYRADGAVVDLGLALDSPKALPPRVLWAHNPQGPSRPHWAWIRPRPGVRRVEALLLWGAFAFDCSGACDDHGLFVRSPVSMPNPPVWVHLREPGWVDFGRGRIPDELEIPAFEAVTAARLSTGGQSPVGLVAPEVVAQFRADPGFATAVLGFFGQKPELVRQVFTARQPRTYVADLTGDPPAVRHPDEPFDGPRYRALREARGLSQAEVARLATALLPEHPVSDDQVRVVERSGSPRARQLRSRLDTVYRADGRTGTEELEVTGARSPFSIDFPTYWIGPVWATLLADRPTTTRQRIQLRFGLHTKEIIARPSTTVTCRRSVPEKEPLEVICPDGWRVRAGMGVHPEARDVNWGWRNAGDVSSRGDASVHELFLGLFGRTGAEFEQLLRRFTG